MGSFLRQRGPCRLGLVLGVFACYQIYSLSHIMNVGKEDGGLENKMDVPSSHVVTTASNESETSAIVKTTTTAGGTTLTTKTRTGVASESNIIDRHSVKSEDLPLLLLSRTPSSTPSLVVYAAAETTTRPIWEKFSTVLPGWMNDYFEWHKEQRQIWKTYDTKDNDNNLRNNNNKDDDDNRWRSHRYLVMTCRQDSNCGGAADRLRPAVALLRLAADTQRVFLIHWDRPAPLEEFLLPPRGGIDWRVPNWLLPKLQLSNTVILGNLKGIIRAAQSRRPKRIIVPTQYQSPTYGEGYYNQNIINITTNNTTPLQPYELPMNVVFPYVWKVLFTPAPPVAQRVQDHLNRLQLIPGQYTSIHVRTYHIEPGRNEAKNTDAQTLRILRRDVRNAIHCGSELQPGGPFFFSSDSLEATRTALEYGSFQNASVVSSSTIDNNNNTSRGSDDSNRTLQLLQQQQQQPLHLGFVEPKGIHSNKNNNNNASVAAVATLASLYDIFVDLYLLSLGRCVTYGGGGFGGWAFLLSTTTSAASFNHNNNNNNMNTGCGFRHGKRGRLCSWKQMEDSSTNNTLLPPNNNKDNQQQHKQLPSSSFTKNLFFPIMEDNDPPQ